MLKKIIKRFLLLSLVSFFLNQVSEGQINTPIDLYTGNPVVSIPLYEISEGDLSVPISFSYKAGAVKLAQQKAEWALLGGGSIKRAVYGYPDDYKGSTGMQGWLYGNGASFVKNFAGPAGYDPISMNDYYINLSTFSGSSDLEMDVFSFSFSGFSGQFVFDNDKIIQTFPYQDMKIVPTYSTDGSITSFTVTSNVGVVYQFEPIQRVNEKVNLDCDPSKLYYMREKYLKYSSQISYTTEWGLSRISSPSGAQITLTYEDYGGGTGTLSLTPRAIYLRHPFQASYIKQSLYTIEARTITKRLKSIENYRTKFSREPDQETAVPWYGVYAVRENGVLLKNINISEKGVFEYNNNLKNPGYRFYYNTVLPEMSSCSYSNCPSIDSYQQDFWGNYRGGSDNNSLVPNLHAYPDSPYPYDKIRLQQKPGSAETYISLNGGNDRNANPNTVAYGALYKVEYPTGGYLEIEYESNQYTDLETNTIVNGGGIRVKKTTINDGVSSLNNIVKNYSYSGGRLLNRPQYSFPLHAWFNPVNNTLNNLEGMTMADQYRFGIAKTEYDINPYVFDGPDVVYTSAEEKLEGKGKTVYTFKTPAVYCQETSPEYPSPDNWKATRVNVISFGDPLAYQPSSKGLIVPGANLYPYAPNPNYSFERGLIENIKIYNEAGEVLKETAYEYTPIYKNTNVNKVYGLTFDCFSHEPANKLKCVFPYARYEIWTGISKLTSKEIEITADPTLVTRKARAETNLSYGGPTHLLLSSTSSSFTTGGATNVTTYTSKFKYVQDYVSSDSYSDPAALNIKKLQDRNMNALVIEKISTMKKTGGAEKVTGASLTKFNTFPGDKLFPSQALVFRPNVPVTDFVQTSIPAGTGTLTYDGRYETVANFLEYNKTGNLVSRDDNKYSLSSVLYNEAGSIPVAVISNATADQVVYSNFDDHSDHSFGTATPTIPGYDIPGGKIGMCWNTNANYIFSKDYVMKGTGQNYIFSSWIKSLNPGSLTITLTDNVGHSSVKSVPYSNTSGVWTFYRVKIPVNNMNSVFEIQVKTPVPAMFDEMVFFPELASLSLTTYRDLKKVGESDIRGNLTSYEYDNLGRITYIRDKDNNIIKRNMYSYQENVSVSAMFGIYKTSACCINEIKASEHILVNESITFHATPVADNNYTRTWDFGDGATASYQGQVDATHAYTAPGTYTVSSTINHPLYGSATYKKTLTVTKGLEVAICTGGIIAYELCTNTVYQKGACADQVLGTNTFTANVSNGCSGGTYTYKWEKALQSAPDSWATMRTFSSTAASDNVTYMAHPPYYAPPYTYPLPEESYIIRCTVTVDCSLTDAGSASQSISFLKNCN